MDSQSLPTRAELHAASARLAVELERLGRMLGLQTLDDLRAAWAAKHPA